MHYSDTIYLTVTPTIFTQAVQNRLVYNNKIDLLFLKKKQELVVRLDEDINTQQHSQI